MASPSVFGRLFSLETLDLRFTTSSKDPLPDPAKPDTRTSASTIAANAPPSLWRTPEFYFYYLVFGVCVPLMFKSVYEVSQPSHPNYSNFESLLSPGWIGGRKVDNSDLQYSFFRNHLLYLFALLMAHPFLRKAYEQIAGQDPSSNATPASSAQHRSDLRLKFDFFFALIFISVLHGLSIFKILLILYVNFCIATKLPKQYIVPATWVFNVASLFGNELSGGYPYHKILAFFSSGLGSSEKNWGNAMDEIGGLVPRWEVMFKCTILRMISFNLDYYWSLGRSTSNSLEKKQLDPSNLSERDRVDIPPAPRDFRFRNYLAYALYAPLYLAGPIVTFNDFVSQSKYAPRSITSARTFRYGLRFIACLLAMEVMIHYVYAVAISKAKPAWEVYSPFQVSMLGFFNLHHIWLKLLLPWRFFRLWSLIDGVDPPENMVRCVSNNYSALAFWRGWHRSFNRWVIRYIYIPLGGSATPGMSPLMAKVRTIINFVPVFTFVAIWHDIQLRLLIWGWLVIVFFIPEILASLAFPPRNWKERRTEYRILCGIGAVGTILMMMVANLVGFALGVDGIMGLIHGIVGSYLGVIYVVVACLALFVGVQVMFETRESEKRRGIKMNC